MYSSRRKKAQVGGHPGQTLDFHYYIPKKVKKKEG
jgi:hypothetical protein